MIEWLQGKKTYILVGIGVLGALVHFLTGDLTFLQFVQSEEFIALLALLGIGTAKAGLTREMTK
jgi:hypothetical protein